MNMKKIVFAITLASSFSAHAATKDVCAKAKLTMKENLTAYSYGAFQGAFTGLGAGMAVGLAASVFPVLELGVPPALIGGAWHGGDAGIKSMSADIKAQKIWNEVVPFEPYKAHLFPFFNNLISQAREYRKFAQDKNSAFSKYLDIQNSYRAEMGRKPLKAEVAASELLNFDRLLKKCGVLLSQSMPVSTPDQATYEEEGAISERDYSTSHGQYEMVQ